jgi:hypothetical protein
MLGRDLESLLNLLMVFQIGLYYNVSIVVWMKRPVLWWMEKDINNLWS